VVSASLEVVRVGQQELELDPVRLVLMLQPAALDLPFSSVLELGCPNGLAVQMMQENSVLALVLVVLVAPQSMKPRRQRRWLAEVPMRLSQGRHRAARFLA